MKTWIRNWPSLLALLILLSMVVASRGGLATLVPLVRLAAVVLVLWALFRWGKQRLIRYAMERIQRQLSRAAKGGFGGFQADVFRARDRVQRQNEKVVDLCPDCGEYLKHGHRCQPQGH